MRGELSPPREAMASDMDCVGEVYGGLPIGPSVVSESG